MKTSFILEVKVNLENEDSCTGCPMLLYNHHSDPKQTSFECVQGYYGSEPIRKEPIRSLKCKKEAEGVDIFG